jgi:hypothetical protein
LGLRAKAALDYFVGTVHKLGDHVKRNRPGTVPSLFPVLLPHDGYTERLHCATAILARANVARTRFTIAVWAMAHLAAAAGRRRFRSAAIGVCNRRHARQLRSHAASATAALTDFAGASGPVAIGAAAIGAAATSVRARRLFSGERIGRHEGDCHEQRPQRKTLHVRFLIES